MPTLVRFFSLGLLLAASNAFAAENPFVGRWGLTLPDGRAGWLGVEEKNGQLTASLLWGSGSVLPVEEVTLAGDTLRLIRVQPTQKGQHKQLITATRKGDALSLQVADQRANGKESKISAFAGQRLAELPPRPDLAKVKFGEPIALIANDDLAGWELVNKDAPSGWSVTEGVLSNRVQKEPGKRFANLRTKREFGDFRLTTDVRVPAGGNSGIYLRGMYEIQVAETFGKPRDAHHMGALYSRLTPSESAERPAGEWQTLAIALVDSHVTVILNGKTIIDNQPVLGCTGGALASIDSGRGPLMLQGDHTDVDYRHMRLFPVEP